MKIVITRVKEQHPHRSTCPSICGFTQKRRISFKNFYDSFLKISLIALDALRLYNRLAASASFQIYRIQRRPLAPEFCASRRELMCRLCCWVFQWFFILSVPLGKSPAIRDHLHSFTGQSILKFSSKLSLPFEGNWSPGFILNISAYEKGNWLNKQSWSTYLLVTEAWQSAHLLLKRSTKASDPDACSLSIWACSFSRIPAALQLENNANIASSYSLIPLKN